MAADVACSPKHIWWLVGMGCGQEIGASWAELLVLGLTGCSWWWRPLPCSFTAQLEMNRHFLVHIVAPNICSMSLPLNPAVLPDFQV